MNIKIVDINDSIGRKRYKYAIATLSKIAKRRKNKRLKRERDAKIIVTVNSLVEILVDDAVSNR